LGPTDRRPAIRVAEPPPLPPWALRWLASRRRIDSQPARQARMDRSALTPCLRSPSFTLVVPNRYAHMAKMTERSGQRRDLARATVEPGTRPSSGVKLVARQHLDGSRPDGLAGTIAASVAASLISCSRGCPRCCSSNRARSFVSDALAMRVCLSRPELAAMIASSRPAGRPSSSSCRSSSRLSSAPPDCAVDGRGPQLCSCVISPWPLKDKTKG
jgi:hypothetical protein